MPRAKPHRRFSTVPPALRLEGVRARACSEHTRARVQRLLRSMADTRRLRSLSRER